MNGNATTKYVYLLHADGNGGVDKLAQAPAGSGIVATWLANATALDVIACAACETVLADVECDACDTVLASEIECPACGDKHAVQFDLEFVTCNTCEDYVWLDGVA